MLAFRSGGARVPGLWAAQLGDLPLREPGGCANCLSYQTQLRKFKAESDGQGVSSPDIPSNPSCDLTRKALGPLGLSAPQHRAGPKYQVFFRKDSAAVLSLCSAPCPGVHSRTQSLTRRLVALYSKCLQCRDAFLATDCCSPRGFRSYKPQPAESAEFRLLRHKSECAGSIQRKYVLVFGQWHGGLPGR